MISRDIDNKYFREWRKNLGFNNANLARGFFKAGDITAGVDYTYIESLNNRLYEIICKINENSKLNINMEDFKSKYIDTPYNTIKYNKILPRLNNQGRRPESVYYSWMRGFVICNCFIEPIAKMFGVSKNQIIISGDDDLGNVESFRRTPVADLEVDMSEVGKVRLEIQSGFTGINDIKQHKVLEAKRAFSDDEIITLVIHFDIFNGQVAIVRIDNIPEDSVNWITRQQMEGQTVFNIDQNNFVWKLTDDCPEINEIKEIINGEE